MADREDFDASPSSAEVDPPAPSENGAATGSTSPPPDNGDGDDAPAEEAAEGVEQKRSQTGPFEPDNGTASVHQQGVFREMLKHPSAQSVVMQIRNFLQGFPTSGITRNEAASRVHAFLTKTQDWMLSESVVFAADADEEGRSNAAEGLEKFVLLRLHSRVFGIEESDKAEDELIHRQIAGLKWVKFINLKGPEVDPELLLLAIQQLQSIDSWKAPKDKLVCIINACKVVNDVLKRSLSSSGRPLAADDFLPLLIYTVLQANPPQLHSNIEFVAAFRHPARLVAEDAYYFVALQSAVAFAKDAGPKVLDVTAEEFELFFSLSQQEVFAAEEAAAAAAATKENGIVFSAPPATVAEKATSLSPTQHAKLCARFKSLPLTFEAVDSSRLLKVRDVGALLEEYREMARILRDLDDPAAISGQSQGYIAGSPHHSQQAAR